MPKRLPHPCGYPGCPNLADERYCPAHKQKVEQAYNQERGSAAARGYDARWRRTRAMVLAEEPLCRECAKEGRTVPATEVHHRDGNVENMTRENLESICKPCHSRLTLSGRVN